jgi:hypothetical protein
MIIEKARNQAQTIGTEQWCYSLGLFFYFKGTPSQEEHQTGFRAFTTFEKALAG